MAHAATDLGATISNYQVHRGASVPTRLNASTHINFMEVRFLDVDISIVMSLAAIALMIKPDFNYGIDFRGGIQVEAHTSSTKTLSDYRTMLGNLNLGEVSI